MSDDYISSDNYSFYSHQERVKTTALKLSQETAWYNALGLGDEAGEVQGQIKKLYRDDEYNEDPRTITPERRKGIMKEMGDQLWYLCQLANVLDISLEEVALLNIEKLAKRKELGLLKGSGDDREEMTLILPPVLPPHPRGDQ